MLSWLKKGLLILADKTYDADWIRQQIEDQGATPRGLQVQQDESMPYEFIVQITMRGDGFASVLCPTGIRHAFKEEERVTEWLGDADGDRELEFVQRTAGDEAEKGINAVRKAGATMAADNGATEHQLMAIYGWESPKQAALYTRKANRRKLAGGAMHLIAPPSRGTEEEQTVITSEGDCSPVITSGRKAQ